MLLLIINNCNFPHCGIMKGLLLFFSVKKINRYILGM